MRLFFLAFMIFATSGQAMACFTMTRYEDRPFDQKENCAFVEAGGLLPTNAGPSFTDESGLHVQRLAFFAGCYWQRMDLVVDCGSKQVVLLPIAGSSDFSLPPLDVKPVWPEFLSPSDKESVASLRQAYDNRLMSTDEIVAHFASLEPKLDREPDPFCACTLPEAKE